jgi:uncharacterized Zn finger protein
LSIIVERILNEARTLSPDDREDLLTVLEFDLHGGSSADQEADDPAVIAEWGAELAKRSTEVKLGKVKLFSHDNFMSAFADARDEIASRATAK